MHADAPGANGLRAYFEVIPADVREHGNRDRQRTRESRESLGARDGQAVSTPVCRAPVTFTHEDRLGRATRSLVGYDGFPVPNLISAEGSILERILDTAYSISPEGLSRPAYAKFYAAQMKTAWGRRGQRRLALVDGDHVLASATEYELAAVLDGRPVCVRGIGTVLSEPEDFDGRHAPSLVSRMVEQAGRDGATLALLFFDGGAQYGEPNSFEAVATTEVELTVAESTRHGAPMTLIRGGEERDLAAIVAMGQVRASPFRFHLDRDVDFLHHAIMRKRLLAGFGTAGARQLHFFIAEEGITAAAYVVISVVGDMWTIEECGDRDPSGARVGAILQALIAREPVERRPTIRGRLPAGFVPPQVTIVSAKPSLPVMMVRTLGSTVLQPRLSSGDVLYWQSDIF
jgi:hypothetical protein